MCLDPLTNGEAWTYHHVNLALTKLWFREMGNPMFVARVHFGVPPSTVGA